MLTWFVSLLVLCLILATCASSLGLVVVISHVNLNIQCPCNQERRICRPSENVCNNCVKHGKHSGTLEVNCTLSVFMLST
jgi:hypothetical protein